MPDPLPRIHPKTPSTLTLEPLTAISFAPFGTAILPPLPQDLTTIPSSLPLPIPSPFPSPSPSSSSHHESSTSTPTPQYANQRTALKTSPVSPLINKYPSPTASKPQSTGLMSIFSCFPRTNITFVSDPSNNNTIKPKPKPTLQIPILERHPYTTQTFTPFNFSSPSSSSSSTTTTDKAYYLVIVAPTLPSSPAPISEPTTQPHNPPDLSLIRAFYAPVAINPSSTINNGVMGTPTASVTYNPGTWHAPMIVVGSRRVDFLVVQHVNGVEGDDCQEVLVGGGSDSSSSPSPSSSVGDSRGLTVQVDLSSLNLSFPSSSSSPSTGLKSKL